MSRPKGRDVLLLGSCVGTLAGVWMMLKTAGDFDFGSAICSHGFFVLAPNVWEPAGQRLDTVITLDDRMAVQVAISATRAGNVSLRLADGLTGEQLRRVRLAVERMLRLDEDLSGFHDLCRRSDSHREAARMRFGRLLRSASLFEDIVKVICTCNVAWRQTAAMVDQLVIHWGVPVGDESPGAVREGSMAHGDGGLIRRHGFPTPGRLARAGQVALRRKARVGYRAAFIQRLAREVAEGKLDVDEIERFEGSSDELCRMLRSIHGIGDYGAGHLCMLLGRYDRLAIDTEMVRFLNQKHPRRKWTPAAMRTYYARWHPFQFLAYWFELWRGYVDEHGQSDQWESERVGQRITARRKRS